MRRMGKSNLVHIRGSIRQSSACGRKGTEEGQDGRKSAFRQNGIKQAAKSDTISTNSIAQLKGTIAMIYDFTASNCLCQ